MDYQDFDVVLRYCDDLNVDLLAKLAELQQAGVDTDAVRRASEIAERVKRARARLADHRKQHGC